MFGTNMSITHCNRSPKVYAHARRQRPFKPVELALPFSKQSKETMLSVSEKQFCQHWKRLVPIYVSRSKELALP